ncbi:hypothetical protein KMP11_06990 [Gemella sp. zg-570]|uniref:hypothetical protein n=1 Tax=Gemella sp. zg-570 TaxID=2840371 RepID=UPI001C0B3BE8|nr:hypothetical protein [Gemella sp. zg-570]QWQ38683.1 hypothetical protein KMP11_06990 [Gemella sp. zg-570]
MSMHITGNNSHGFSNEEILVKCLNNKSLQELSSHLKQFILSICSDNQISISDNTIITSEIATKELDPVSNKKINVKPDFYIHIKDSTFGISTKIGNGNSVHQEDIESFINWLKSLNSVNDCDESVYNDLRLLIWADGTIDGTAPIKRDLKGNVIGRFSTTQFKILFSDKWTKIQNLLTNNKEAIIRRALFFGKVGKEVHYIYHGNERHGSWIKQSKLLEFNLENEIEKSTFNVGRLSFQTYNADLKGTDSGKKKRGYIQLKYGNIQNDLANLMLQNTNNMGTFEGNIEEFSFSKLLNKNKSHSFWKYLSADLNLDTNNHYYVIKVVGHKFSKNAKKKVMCKSDNYIIRTCTPIDRNLLLKNDYQLTEEDLKLIPNYEILNNSGISVKLKDSKNYTITKMSVTNFKDAFTKYIDEIDNKIATLIFYCDKKQVNKNPTIANNLNVNIENYIKFCNEYYKINVTSILDYSALGKLTTLVKNEIKQVIDANIDLKEALFQGKGWFNPPYYTSFLFSHGKLSKELLMPYHIDNGSGRSKGKYYITIKPN